MPEKEACQAHTVDLNLEKAVIGLNNAESATLFDNRNIFQSHDTLTRMKEKAEMIMSRSDTRVNFTWLLWNVHLTDVTRTCLTGGTFRASEGIQGLLLPPGTIAQGIAYAPDWRRSENAIKGCCHASSFYYL
ncbi:hypothetical protein MRX96_015485 [Rhipicephalus microplus]